MSLVSLVLLLHFIKGPNDGSHKKCEITIGTLGLVQAILMEFKPIHMSALLILGTLVSIWAQYEPAVLNDAHLSIWVTLMFHLHNLFHHTPLDSTWAIVRARELANVM